jgi:hypothetical protein
MEAAELRREQKNYTQLSSTESCVHFKLLLHQVNKLTQMIARVIGTIDQQI